MSMPTQVYIFIKFKRYIQEDYIEVTQQQYLLEWPETEAPSKKEQIHKKYKT